MSAAQDPEAVLSKAVAAVRSGRRDELSEFDASPLAVYVTDPAGVITYYNPACIGFAGRTPALGQDRWCVTWKLFTSDGAQLPHDECPMAVALKEQRPVRGERAVAERPDGARVEFMPFPTPVLAEDGSLLGGVNILIGLDSTLSAADMRALARRYRRLAMSVDAETATELERLSDELESRAGRDPSTH